jgi:hypothetical protein
MSEGFCFQLPVDRDFAKQLQAQQSWRSHFWKAQVLHQRLIFGCAID